MNVTRKVLEQLLAASQRGTGSVLTPAMVKALADGPLSTSLTNMEITLRRERDARLAALVASQDQVRMRREARKRVEITGKMAKAIREARLAGATFAEIMVQFNVSQYAAMRYGEPKHDENIKAYERKRTKRLRSDPAYADQLERRRQRAREYHARIREETRRIKANEQS